MSTIEEQQELSDWLVRVKAASKEPVVHEPTGLSIEKFLTFKAEDTALVQATREEQQNLRILKDNPNFVSPLQRGLWGIKASAEDFLPLSGPTSSLDG